MKPLELYRTVTAWCKDFEKENKRKATFDDFFSWKNKQMFQGKLTEMPKQ